MPQGERSEEFAVTSVEAVDVRQLINQSALSRWQKRLIAL